MSHFATIIIVPKEHTERQANIMSYISKTMHKFDEQLEVEPYIEYSIDKIDEYYNDAIEEFEESRLTSNLENYNQQYCLSRLLELISMTPKEYFDELARFNTKDEQGNALSTRNPLGKHDYFRIGGRFDGFITDNRQRSENGFNFNAKHETIKNNSIFAGKYLEKLKNPEDYICYAIVDQNGNWFDRDDNVSLNHFQQKYVEIVENSDPENLIVTLDCHS